MIAELRERVAEELDYRREAASQQRFAAHYEGHPTIHVPRIVGVLSTRRVVTSELSDGARFTELPAGPSRSDLAKETIYRFVFRSLYKVRAFNGTRTPATSCSTAAARSPSWISGWSNTSPSPNCSRSWK